MEAEMDGSVDAAADALFSKINVEEGDTEDREEDESPRGQQDQDDDQERDGAEEESDQDQPEDDEDADQDDDDADDEESEEDQPEASDDDQVVKIEVDGEEREVSLKDLKSGYMLHEDYTRKTQELAEGRRSFIAQAQQHQAALQQQMEEAGFLAQTFMQQLVEVEKDTDWDQLRRENPAEWAARQQDIVQRRELLQRAYQTHLQAKAMQDHVQQQEMAQYVADQSELLPTLIPEWVNPRAANEEKERLAKYLVDLGVDPAELDQLNNALTVAVSRKAMRYDELMAAKAKAKSKQHRPVPKFNRSGKPNRKAITRSRHEKAMQRARKTGSTDDFADALFAKYGN